MDRRKVLLVVAVLVAALGAGLVFVYAQGAEDRAAGKAATTQVLVAVAQIQPGESASDAANADKFLLADVPNDQLLEGATADGNEFADTVALTTIYPGEQVVTQKFGTIQDIEGRPTLPIPEGKGAVTFELTEEEKVGSFAQPGSHVAVYVTPAVDQAQLTPAQQEAARNGSVFATPSCLFEDDLLVLGVGSTSVNSSGPTTEDDAGQDNAQGEVVGTTLMTVAVDAQEAAGLIGLRDAVDPNGQDRRIGLRFVLRTDESRLRPTRGCAELLELYHESLELAGGQATQTEG